MSSGKTVTLNTGYKIPYVCSIEPQGARLTNLCAIGSWDTAPGRLRLARSGTASTRL
jgi:hypothetical protein